MTQHNWHSHRLWDRARFKPQSGGQGTQTVQSKSTTEFPQWVNDWAGDIRNQTYNVASNLWPVYSGQRYATMPGLEGAIIQNLTNNALNSGPQFLAGQQAVANASTYKPQQIGPGFLSGDYLKQFEDPFTQDVINKSLPILEQQKQLALNQNADLARRQGAFPGASSRAAIQDAVTNAQFGLQGEQTAALLNSQNFAQARAAAMAAALANQQAALQGTGLNLQAGATLANQANQAQTAGIAGQQLNQQDAQGILNALMQETNERRQYPIDQLQIMMAGLRGVPYGQTQTTTQTGPGPSSNPALSFLGGGLVGTQILGNLSNLFGGGATSSGVPGLLAAMVPGAVGLA